MYSCSNQVCRQSFKWRQQLARHRLKRDKTVIEKKENFKKLEDGCLSCGVIYKYQTGICFNLKSKI